MNTSRMLAVTLRQVYLIRGSFPRVLPLFIWVAVDMVLWGFLTRFLNSIANAGVNFIYMFLGAVLMWDFFIRVMQGVTMAFLEDVWSRNFLNFFATPITTMEYVGGLVLTSIGTSAIGLAVMLVLATAIFGLTVFAYGAAIVPFLIELFLFGIALGVMSIALVLRLGPAAEWFIWPIPGLLSPFAGVFYPISILPHWMQCVSYVLPPSYIFESMRTIIQGGQASPVHLALGGALAVAYVMIAFWLFHNTYRHAMRTGLLARYSAESSSY
ncbi:ABC transporter permease [bacterium]|nr:ABC transporter permease [bacterium]